MSALWRVRCPSRPGRAARSADVSWGKEGCGLGRRPCGTKAWRRCGRPEGLLTDEVSGAKCRGPSPGRRVRALRVCGAGWAAQALPRACTASLGVLGALNGSSTASRLGGRGCSGPPSGAGGARDVKTLTVGSTRYISMALRLSLSKAAPCRAPCPPLLSSEAEGVQIRIPKLESQPDRPARQLPRVATACERDRPLHFIPEYLGAVLQREPFHRFA